MVAEGMTQQRKRAKAKVDGEELTFMATTSAGTPKLSSESEGTERVRMVFAWR